MTGKPAIAGALVLAALLAATGARAQEPRPATGGIYRCIDAQGRALTSDRPIPACADREQQVLNRDGSVRTIHPPSMTAEERAAKEQKDREAAAARAAQAEAMRRDRGLMLRYPNEAAHLRAREAALDTVRQAIRTTEQRLRELAIERRPLDNEAEFYAGKPLPPKLKQSLDANDAAVEAQRAVTQTQQAELDRINRVYDAELERLRRLWAGAVPGSLGPLSAASAAR